MNPENEQTQRDKKDEEPGDRPEVHVWCRNIPYASIRRPVIGIGGCICRTGSGSDPGRPEEEPGDLETLLIRRYRAGQKTVPHLSLLERLSPVLGNAVHGLRLCDRQGKGVLGGIVAVLLDLAYGLGIDHRFLQVIELHVALLIVLPRPVIPHGISYEVQCGSRELRPSLAPVAPNASMVHQAVTLVDVLPRQDIRFLEEDFAVGGCNLPRIGRQLIPLLESAGKKNDHSNHETKNSDPFKLWYRHNPPPL